MKLIIHDYAGHAFPIQLSRELARRGHDVLHLYAGHNQTPRGELQGRDDDPSSLAIRGVFIRKPLHKGALIQRWFQEREYGRCLKEGICDFRPQIVLSANTPLDAQKAILKETHRQGASFAFWLQDFIGIATLRILGQKLPMMGKLIGEYYLKMEKRLLDRSDAVIGITEDFTPTLKDLGIDPERIHIIPNWAPIDKIPVLPRQNQWAREQGIEAEFVFMYTGTLGMKHDPRLLRALAGSNRKKGEAKTLMVVSEGPAAEWLRLASASSTDHGLLVRDFQPAERYAEVMASADVLIAILGKAAGAFSVPSKILSYLCAGRPLLLSVPRENLAARIVTENEAGIVVEPGDTASFLEGAQWMYEHPEARKVMGENARRFAEAHFRIDSIAARFEIILQGLLPSSKIC